MTDWLRSERRSRGRIHQRGFALRDGVDEPPEWPDGVTPAGMPGVLDDWLVLPPLLPEPSAPRMPA
jgi:hypothetical protein